MMAAMLEAAGFSVHVYTSPHLVRFNERIRVAGREIEDGPLAALLEECEAANAGGPVTFFEITTAAAFLAFARTQADVTILETGLGGRLDATNVIRRPALTAITQIAMDHQHFLGDTLDAIAFEKAGILKAEVPCVLAAQARKAARVIKARADQVGAPLATEGADWFVMPRPEGMLFKAGGTGRAFPRPALAGKFQLGNAGVAIAGIDRLGGFRVSDEAIAQGLLNVRWPARLQRLIKGPLSALLPEGWELWLDGGHNPGAGKALAEHMRRWRDKPLYLVFGMMTGKDPVGYLEPLAPAVTALRGVTIPGESNAMPAEKTVLAAGYVAIPAEVAPDVEAAVRDLVTQNSRPGRILICGSLYLAGTVLADNG